MERPYSHVGLGTVGDIGPGVQNTVAMFLQPWKAVPRSIPPKAIPTAAEDPTFKYSMIALGAVVAFGLGAWFLMRPRKPKEAPK